METDSDGWAPTSHLRWLVRTNYLETGHETYTRQERTLEQLWFRRDGDTEWREVEALIA